MADDPYSRSYWRFADEFPDIYADDAAYALWHRLLVIGDGAWPSSGTLPFHTKRAALSKLVDADLIILNGHDRFRVRGMDKHREARSDAARKAAALRWQSDRNADA